MENGERAVLFDTKEYCVYKTKCKKCIDELKSELV